MFEFCLRRVTIIDMWAFPNDVIVLFSLNEGSFKSQEQKVMFGYLEAKLCLFHSFTTTQELLFQSFLLTMNPHVKTNLRSRLTPKSGVNSGSLFLILVKKREKQRCRPEYLFEDPFKVRKERKLYQSARLQSRITEMIRQQSSVELEILSIHKNNNLPIPVTLTSSAEIDRPSYGGSTLQRAWLELSTDV